MRQVIDKAASTSKYVLKKDKKAGGAYPVYSLTWAMKALCTKQEKCREFVSELVVTAF
jgi:hypothetical protein